MSLVTPLLGTYNSSGAPVQEYVYLGDMPLAILSSAGTNHMVHYVYTDQVMRPWTVTNSLNSLNPAERVVWTWDTSPFGELLPNEVVKGTKLDLFLEIVRSLRARTVFATPKINSTLPL